jgi:hypothetical protein
LSNSTGTDTTVNHFISILFLTSNKNLNIELLF